MNREQDDRHYWYKDAIIYELHIKAFFDSNGDGVGDLQGLMQKLDYLRDLGITAIWLLPFYPSPLRDDGYDIADYYTFNPAYGDVDLFREFLTAAHQRGLKVITELVINHTSDQHPWFQKARQAPKDSPDRSFYVWTDNPAQYKDARIIFQDYETSNWTWDPVAEQYYWHRFFHHQPDLNFDNPEVQAEVFRILDFWCGLGVDGFRLDAVPYLFEREATNCENLPETHAFLKRLRRHVDTHYPNTLLLAEANMWPEDSAAYFGEGDECHMNYHFPVMPRMFMALQMEDRYPITDIFDQTPAIPDNCQWAIFLRNHDELTLEMVTDEERDYMYKVYATDPKARINLGIRQRLAPLMQNNRRKIELINSLLLSLPGTPVIYYGDEIGMGDNFYLGDRDGVRTPMQWSPNRNGGFSEANPQKLYLPLILSPEYHYEIVNVELQSANPSSLLWYMKRMIDLRKKFKAFGRGDFRFLMVDNPKILAFIRSYEEETLLVVVNLSRYAQPAELDLHAFEGFQPIELQSRNKFPVIKDTRYFLSLGGHSFQWFALQNLSAAVITEKDLPEYSLEHFDALTEGLSGELLLNTILPEWLKRVRWFGGKGREIHHIELEDQQNLVVEGTQTVAWLLLKVHYYYGFPEIYQLPLVFIPKGSAEDMTRDYPQSIIVNLSLGAEEGYLCDALYDTRLHRYLMQRLAAGEGYLKGMKVSCNSTEALREIAAATGRQLKSRLLHAEQSNTSVIFEDKFYLKLYRKVDYDINPDQEMIRMLTGPLQFEYAPAFMGTVDWISGKGNITLAMVQQLVENHGDAWLYMQEKLTAYNDLILSQPADQLPGTDLCGTITAPCRFEELPDQIRELIDPSLAAQARLIGIRTAEMHLKLMSATGYPAFRPEPYSLHYQRSIYSSLITQVREAFDNLERNLPNLDVSIREVAQTVIASRSTIMSAMKAIYRRKLDLMKIRIHGDYHLGQILFTGKDLVILDFEGEPARSYSERRLKFSSLRDVAGMIRSFHYAAYGSLFLEGETRNEDVQKLTPYSELWSHYMSSFFMQAYLEMARGTGLIPDAEEDIRILLDVFLLSKAFYELNYELNNRPGWVMIPLKGIMSILQNETAAHELTDSKASQ
ncbi:maltose alpha-D-glucosyltransferase [Taibaiella koreensis]|uniref:maltose alpha-D-glucosyltransferase n=1 Tax=Taibaiella koreensis TaxID=1268548 RepID=UPI000E59D76E|nr:maltose alpha-D-glucosyltransferase [Taibaiella koreensis]